MNITATATATNNNNNNMLAEHMANSHHTTSRGMVETHPRTVKMVEAFPTASPTQQCVNKMVESSNKATHTQKFEIPTDEICPEQLLATHVNTWMSTADEFISIATGLLTSWQVTELSTKACSNILMKSGFNKALQIIQLHGIDEYSPVCYALEDAFCSRYKAYYSSVRFINNTKNQKLWLHAELMKQPAPVLKPKMRVSNGAVFVTMKEWIKMKMAARTKKLKAKSEVFIAMDEWNKIAARMDELIQMVQQHIDQCDEFRKECATRGTHLTGVKDVELLDCEKSYGAEDLYWVHDLNNSINNHNSEEWWKEYTTSTQHAPILVKYMYSGVIGTMKLHDLTGWLKKQSTSQFKFMYHSVIGGMKVHDLTGWVKD
jgi:hypothetical protein